MTILLHLDQGPRLTKLPLCGATIDLAMNTVVNDVDDVTCPACEALIDAMHDEFEASLRAERIAAHGAILVRGHRGKRGVLCDCGEKFPAYPHPEVGMYETPEWETHVKESSVI